MTIVVVLADLGVLVHGGLVIFKASCLIVDLINLIGLLLVHLEFYLQTEALQGGIVVAHLVVVNTIRISLALFFGIRVEDLLIYCLSQLLNSREI